MRRGLAFAGLVILALTVSACNPTQDEKPTPSGEGAGDAVEEIAVPEESPGFKGPVFVDRAEATGLVFHQFNGATGRFYMAEVTGSGAALLDYDLDGDLDVYLVQGSVLEPGKSLQDSLFPLKHDRPVDRLFRNDLNAGELRFTDVTDESGILADGYGMGAAVGDVDADGYPDIYVTNVGSNQLWRNRGDGTFEEIAAEAGVEEDRWSVPAMFFDFDRDGFEDLFVGNYAAVDIENPKLCRGITGAQDYCGPTAYPPLPDRLFRNRGDGTFEDVTYAKGLRSGFGPALGSLATDLNGDGFLDIYVANDQANNQMWIHQGDDTFQDEALLAGSAVNARGRAEASMGVDAGDFDGDGDDDLFMTHLIGETNTLYVNEGAGTFIDRTVDVGLSSPSRLFTAFGTAWIDFDNDSRLDLFVANGAVKAIEQLMIAQDPFPYHHPNQLFHNRDEDGKSVFEDVSALAGDDVVRSEVSRGLAAGDLDNDGDTDLVLVNNNGPSRLLINEIGNQKPWVGFSLRTDVGEVTNGARLMLQLADGRKIWRRARRDGSFAGSNDPRVLIGLGTSAEIEKVEVFWPDGSRESFSGKDMKSGSYNLLTRGSGDEA